MVHAAKEMPKRILLDGLNGPVSRIWGRSVVDAENGASDTFDENECEACDAGGPEPRAVSLRCAGNDASPKVSDSGSIFNPSGHSRKTIGSIPRREVRTVGRFPTPRIALRLDFMTSRSIHPRFAGAPRWLFRKSGMNRA